MHSSIVLTSNTYGHVLEQRQREVAMGMDAVLGGSLSGQSRGLLSIPGLTLQPPAWRGERNGHSYRLSARTIVRRLALWAAAARLPMPG